MKEVIMFFSNRWKKEEKLIIKKKNLEIECIKMNMPLYLKTWLHGGKVKK